MGLLSDPRPEEIDMDGYFVPKKVAAAIMEAEKAKE